MGVEPRLFILASMTLLKNVVTAAVMVLAALNGQVLSAGTTVEFPNVPDNPALQTPGFQKVVIAVYSKNLESDDVKRYIPLAKDGDEFTWIQIPRTHENLYFPFDGHQPTTREAATWSCAYVDNTLTSPITEWYMQMFGWRRRAVAGLPAVNLLKMGKASIHPTPKGKGAPCPQTIDKAILTLSPLSERAASRFAHSRTGLQMSRQEIFWDNFRQIASNPVGRVLLYRLLIEIRRENSYIGAIETGISGNDNNVISQRNNCRSLVISFIDESYFSKDDEFLGLNDSLSDPINILCINSSDQLTADLADDPLHLTLFHEMLHWFMFLRNPQREDCEHCPGLSPSKDNYIFRAYYGDNVEDIPEEWYGQDDDEISCSEIRTILGSPKGPGHASKELPVPEWQFCNGDDLSENAYRASIGLYMRWGHTNSNFVPVKFSISSPSPQRITDAHGVAFDCCKQIMGKLHWALLPDQAIYAGG